MSRRDDPDEVFDLYAPKTPLAPRAPRPPAPSAATVRNLTKAAYFLAIAQMRVSGLGWSVIRAYKARFLRDAAVREQAKTDWLAFRLTDIRAVRANIRWGVGHRAEMRRLGLLHDEQPGIPDHYLDRVFEWMDAEWSDPVLAPKRAFSVEVVRLPPSRRAVALPLTPPTLRATPANPDGDDPVLALDML